MRGTPNTVFLERQSYRRRRLVDWLRLIPIIGLGLWAIPLLWPTQGEETVSTADAVIYMFVVWFVLVLVTAVSVFALRKHEAGQADIAKEQKGS